MRFDTYLPCDILRPYVKTFAISEATAGSTHKVLPDTGVVIGFQYKGALSRIDNGKKMLLSPAGLTGLHDSYHIFDNEIETGSVLVYFKEACVTTLFRQPMHELFQESVSLDNFMLRSALLILEEQLCEAKTDAARIKVVEEFLMARIQPVWQDDLVSTALTLIHKSRGNIRIKDLVKQLHTSPSPLEKKFRQVVGTSPKKFASIVRLRQTIQSYHSSSSFTELGYEVGFYDQAHFIKEFKNFTGETPEKFFAAR